ncbi:hypothetical protein BH11CYA1_BH11CYA1_27260 [soil metagenome]
MTNCATDPRLCNCNTGQQPRFKVVLITNHTHQWANVYDGTEVIHQSDSALRSERHVDQWGLNAQYQPEYLQAEAWLIERHPNYVNSHKK